jgi:hypothetical protein
VVVRLGDYDQTARDSTRVWSLSNSGMWRQRPFCVVETGAGRFPETSSYFLTAAERMSVSQRACAGTVII